MKRFLTKKDLKLKKKQTVYTVIGIIVIIAVYWFLTREKAVEPEAPIVSVTPAQQQDVEIYGEYVGRIRAQQFVEVRARVVPRQSGQSKCPTEKRRSTGAKNRT